MAVLFNRRNVAAAAPFTTAKILFLLLPILLLGAGVVRSFHVAPRALRSGVGRCGVRLRESAVPETEEQEEGTASQATTQQERDPRPAATPRRTVRRQVLIEPDMEAYSSGFTTVFEELPFKLCTPSSKVPDDLRKGTYYRSGPAMFSAGSIVPPKTSIVQPRQPPVPDGADPDRMVPHPFEGDGAVLGVTFTEDGDVAARFRYVRTVAFTNERKKGQRIYSGMDSTRRLGPSRESAGIGNDLPLPLYRHHLQPGLNKNRKNTSNTRAVYWGKRLLSLWEGGQPYKLDSLALSTEGRSRLGGAIRKDADPFGSKIVIDPIKERAIFYGVKPDAKKSELTVYEFDSDFRLVQDGGTDGRVSVDLEGLALVTDFCATENYAVVVQPNIVSNAVKFVVSKEPGQVLSLDENGSSAVTLIPRVGSGKRNLVKVQIPSDDEFTDANLQFVNAYEADDDTIIIDAIRSDGSKCIGGDTDTKWPWAATLDEYRSTASKKALWRYTVNTKTKSVIKTMLCDTHCFFGVVNSAVSTQRHRYIYMNVGGTGVDVAPPQGISKLDTEAVGTGEAEEVWMPEPYEFCGEPMFASRTNSKDEDDGYLLSVLYNGQKKESELIILDAKNISSGPVSRLPLGIAIPHGLFGCYTTADEATWSADKLERRAKLSDKMESRGNMWNEVKSDFSGLGLRFDDMEEYFGDFFS